MIRYSRPKPPKKKAFIFATALCITGANIIARTIISPWTLVTKLDFSRPPSFSAFFSLPLPIRQRIYFHILRNAFASPSYEGTHNFPVVKLPFVYFNLGVLSPSKCSTFEVFRDLLPISTQWHTEIQEVLFSRFDFSMRETLLGFKAAKEGSWCLDFLPGRGVALIERLEINVYLYLDKDRTIIRYEPQTMTKGCEDLSIHLPNLKKVNLHFTPRFAEAEHSGTRPCFQVKLHKEQIRLFIFNLCRPFLKNGVKVSMDSLEGKCRDRLCRRNARFQGRIHVDLYQMVSQLGRSPGFLKTLALPKAGNQVST